MYDTKGLIMAVKKRRLIYNPTHADYKDRRKKADAWRAIADDMGSHSGEYWMRKWKSLRDNYTKFKKSQTTTCTTESYGKYKNWPWAEQMSFLEDYIRPKTDAQASISIDTLKTIKEEIEDSSNFKLKKKRKAASPEPNAVPYSQTNTSGREKFDEVDLFFLSYAKNFKRLSAKCQASMKLEIATLFTRYELNDAPGEIIQNPMVFTYPSISTVYTHTARAPDDEGIS